MRVVVVLGLLAAVLAAGCSKDDSSAGPDQKPEEKDYLALGWSDFDAQRYDAAVTNFTEAYNRAATAVVRGDALNGRGWSYAYKRDLVKSRGDFIFATGLTGIAPAAVNDIRAGAAMVLHALNDFSASITFAEAVLADNPSYVFSHDLKVNAKRMRLLLAQSHYANGQFGQAASHMDIADPSRSPHSTEPAPLLASIIAALNSL